MKYPPIQNDIAGSFVSASIDTVMPVISPLDGTILSTVPMSAIKDLDQAVEAAKKAFPSWSNTPIKERVQVFFRYKTLLEKNLKMLAELCSEENGKTYSESVAEIEKCIELTEFATSLPNDFSFYAKKFSKTYFLGEKLKLELDRVDYEEIKIYLKVKK